jgi:hypothetical protein
VELPQQQVAGGGQPQLDGGKGPGIVRQGPENRIAFPVPLPAQGFPGDKIVGRIQRGQGNQGRCEKGVVVFFLISWELDEIRTREKRLIGRNLHGGKECFRGLGSGRRGGGGKPQRKNRETGPHFPPDFAGGVQRPGAGRAHQADCEEQKAKSAFLSHLQVCPAHSFSFLVKNMVALDTAKKMPTGDYRLNCSN